MGSSVIGFNHSMMAMNAAKRMRRSKQKQKTGHVVCHHLRMMLAAEDPVDFQSDFSRSGHSAAIVPGSLLTKNANEREKRQFTLGI